MRTSSSYPSATSVIFNLGWHQIQQPEQPPKTPASGVFVVVTVVRQQRRRRCSSCRPTAVSPSPHSCMHPSILYFHLYFFSFQQHKNKQCSYTSIVDRVLRRGGLERIAHPLGCHRELSSGELLVLNPRNWKCRRRIFASMDTRVDRSTMEDPDGHYLRPLLIQCVPLR